MNTALWDPNLTLNLHPVGQEQWTCVGVVTTAPGSGSRRCGRPLRAPEVNKIRRLVADIACQMPDQIDFNLLLHLARACLCAEKPEPHQGVQEANVIYEWTGLLSLAAAKVRAGGAAAFADEDGESVVSNCGSGSEGTDVGATMESSAGYSYPRIPSLAGDGNTNPSTTTSISTAYPTPLHLPGAATALPPSPPPSAPLPRLHHPAPLSLSSISHLLTHPLLTSTTIDLSSPTHLPASDFATPVPFHKSTHLLYGIPPPLPTSTTIITNGSSNSSNAAQDPGTKASLRPLPAAVMVAGLRMGRGEVLGELEEYNRLLQETQARHEVLLGQIGRLRGEMRELQREVDGGMASSRGEGGLRVRGMGVGVVCRAVSKLGSVWRRVVDAGGLLRRGSGVCWNRGSSNMRVLCHFVSLVVFRFWFRAFRSILRRAHAMMPLAGNISWRRWWWWREMPRTTGTC